MAPRGARSGGAARACAGPEALAGQAVCVRQEPRDALAAEATRRVVALGGEVQEQVDATTTHLVVGDKGRAGDKLSEARRLQQGGAGPEILDERAFGALLGVGQMSLFS
ncbi:MAG: BRCT domain-containing protein [Polyangiales bacterium]